MSGLDTKLRKLTTDKLKWQIFSIKIEGRSKMNKVQTSKSGKSKGATRLFLA
jgi:hypothetical protein